MEAFTYRLTPTKEHPVGPSQTRFTHARVSLICEMVPVVCRVSHDNVIQKVRSQFHITLT